jgi:predicted nucleic acid-binding protein
MPAPDIAVLDSSVGVKWLKHESGSDIALGLLAQHRDCTMRIVVASHFIHELVGTAVRHGGVDFGQETWAHIEEASLTVVGLDDSLAQAAFQQCRRLRCSFYDALAPALAEQLGGTLFSADQRAHGRFANAVLL